MSGYASSTDLYRELRAALTPWCKAAAWRREPGAKAGWYRLLSEEKRVVFIFSCGRWGNSDTGNTLKGDLRLEPPSGRADNKPWTRASDFTRCLVRVELDELARLHTAVNLRRPRAAAFLREAARRNPSSKQHMGQLYAPVEEPYQEGQYVPLNYYGLDDVRDFASFIGRYLPTVVERFLDDRCPAPVYEPTLPSSRPT